MKMSFDYIYLARKHTQTKIVQLYKRCTHILKNYDKLTDAR